MRTTDFYYVTNKNRDYTGINCDEHLPEDLEALLKREEDYEYDEFTEEEKDEYERLTPIYESDEFDSFPCCDVCSKACFDVVITSDGMKRMWRDNIKITKANCFENEKEEKLSYWAWPGGYTMAYLVKSLNPYHRTEELWCAKCVNDYEKVVGQTNWYPDDGYEVIDYTYDGDSDSTVYCDNCQEVIWEVEEEEENTNAYQ